MTYFNKTAKGEPLKSCSIGITGEKGNVIGLMCINFYVNTPLSEIITRLVPNANETSTTTSFAESFVEDVDENTIIGTFDNSITNAVVTHLMLKEQLYDNVIIAFTGDEERDCIGASQVAKYLSMNNVKPALTIVLDVTSEGWETNSDFTIENNFFNDELGKKVISLSKSISQNFKFVPSDPDDIPHYVDKDHLIPREAWADESWEYDEFNLQCFSFCIPTKGNMHSNNGIYARKKSVEKFEKALLTIANNI
jgi:hypothetical protein